MTVIAPSSLELMIVPTTKKDWTQTNLLNSILDTGNKHS